MSKIIKNLSIFAFVLNVLATEKPPATGELVIEIEKDGNPIFHPSAPPEEPKGNQLGAIGSEMKGKQDQEKMSN